MHITRDIEIARETEMDQEGAHRGPSKRRVDSYPLPSTKLAEGSIGMGAAGYLSSGRMPAPTMERTQTSLNGRPHWEEETLRPHPQVPVAHRTNLHGPEPPRLQGQTQSLFPLETALLPLPSSTSFCQH